VAAGGYAAWTVTDWLALNADISQGLSANAGLLGKIGATLSHRFGPLLVAGGPTLGFADGTYMKSFYSITPGESAASGRQAYNAHGGLLAPGAAATLVMPVTDRIAVTAITNYGRLVGSAAGSPIVKQGGSANQVFGGVFVTWSLF
jgi:outer membrane protein